MISAPWRLSARHSFIDAKCSTWSNKSDENPPEGDTEPPGGDNPWVLFIISSMTFKEGWHFSQFSLTKTEFSPLFLFCTFDLLRSLSFFYCGYLESTSTLVYYLNESKSKGKSGKIAKITKLDSKLQDWKNIDEDVEL